MAGQVQQGVDVGDGHPFRTGGHLADRVACLDHTLTEHPKVEPWPMVAHQQGRQPRLPQPQTHPIAGDPRLAHLEQGLADLVPVTDTHLVVGEPLDREVLAELPRLEVVPAEDLPPVLVGRQLVHQDGAVRSAVPAEVTLAIAIDVEGPHQPRPVDRFLPHPRVNSPSTPLDVAREPDVDRNKATHHSGEI